MRNGHVNVAALQLMAGTCCYHDTIDHFAGQESCHENDLVFGGRPMVLSLIADIPRGRHTLIRPISFMYFFNYIPSPALQWATSEQ